MVIDPACQVKAFVEQAVVFLFFWQLSPCGQYRAIRCNTKAKIYPKPKGGACFRISTAIPAAFYNRCKAASVLE